MRRRAESARPPAVIYREQGLVTKLLRDLLTEDFTAIRIDNAQEYQRVLRDGAAHDADRSRRA